MEGLEEGRGEEGKGMQAEGESEDYLKPDMEETDEFQRRQRRAVARASQGDEIGFDKLCNWVQSRLFQLMNGDSSTVHEYRRSVVREWEGLKLPKNADRSMIEEWLQARRATPAHHTPPRPPRLWPPKGPQRPG